MAYNPFPVGYQPTQFYYPQMQNQVPTPTPAIQSAGAGGNSSIIWVQGEAGAKSYLVAPNTTVQLWDSESQVIYLKSADATGMPSMKIIDYTIRDQGIPQGSKLSSSDFATKEDINTLQSELNGLEAKLKALSGKGEEEENEQQSFI